MLSSHTHWQYRTTDGCSLRSNDQVEGSTHCEAVLGAAPDRQVRHHDERRDSVASEVVMTTFISRSAQSRVE